MKKYCYYILVLLLISCKQSNTVEDISVINGYWEIEKVVLPNGTEKQYGFNQTIDFFEVTDSIGIRKKLQPRLDGTFIGSKDSETFSIQVSNDSLHLFYNNSLSSWKETIISLNQNQMILKNESQNLYFYKRFKKLEL